MIGLRHEGRDLRQLLFAEDRTETIGDEPAVVLLPFQGGIEGCRDGRLLRNNLPAVVRAREVEGPLIAIVYRDSIRRVFLD